MSDDRTQAAVKATAQQISADDALAEARGLGSIPADEVIVQPNPLDYQAPDYLEKTAPDLKPYLDQLLADLCELNSRFVGVPTLLAQAELSFSGEHEEIEEYFLRWCRMYFERRGSLDNLNPAVGNDPWRLYQKCYDEFDRLIEHRIHQVGTINSMALNLSQRYMLSAFARDVLGPDLARYCQNQQSRFGSKLNVARAFDLLAQYEKQVEQFTKVMEYLAANLPADYSPAPGEEWETRIRTRVAQQAEDLTTFRHLVTVLEPEGPRQQQLAPDLWAGLRWDVYHGRSVATVLTSKSADVTSETSTSHALSVRRDGWLCNREFSWIRVDPDLNYESRLPELAVNFYVLDTLIRPLYEAWDKCDASKMIERGIAEGATDKERNAAFAAAVATAVVEEEDEADESAEVTPGETQRDITKGHKLGIMTVRNFFTILRKDFGCTVSKGKGSEKKVIRPGGEYCNVRCHGLGDYIWQEKIRTCLDRLNIAEESFLRSLHKRRG